MNDEVLKEHMNANVIIQCSNYNATEITHWHILPYTSTVFLRGK